jgi:uncharacterized protein involved in cysteine biosynthesis
MSKTSKKIKSVFRKLWEGLVFVWGHPVILSVILLALVVLLSYLLITQTFTDQMKCSYLITNKLGVDAHFCEGILVTDPIWGTTLFKLDGLKTWMDPSLGFIRKVVAWTILISFALLSLYLTIIFNNLKAIVKVLTLNKEEWKRFMASLRTWLLIFSIFCLVFYFVVVA